MRKCGANLWAILRERGNSCWTKSNRFAATPMSDRVCPGIWLTSGSACSYRHCVHQIQMSLALPFTDVTPQ